MGCDCIKCVRRRIEENRPEAGDLANLADLERREAEVLAREEEARAKRERERWVNVDRLRVMTLRGSKWGRSSERLKAGAYGSYFRLNKRQGIKILRAACVKERPGRPGLTVDRYEWTRATNEVAMQNFAHSQGVAVRCGGVVVVRWKKYLYLGLLMKHLDGGCLGDQSEIAWNSVQNPLNRALMRVGLYHRDLHEFNVVRSHRGRWYAIDFGNSSY